MEQFDSYLIQVVSTTGLIAELSNNDYLNSEHFKNLHFTNLSLKKIIFDSGLGNPATLLMFLYALLVAPYEMDKEHKLNLEFKELNDYIVSIIVFGTSNYPEDDGSIDYIRHIRNSISHSKCIFSIINSETTVTFKDSNKKYECEFTIKTSDVGLLLEKIQMKILRYLEEKTMNIK